MRFKTLTLAAVSVLMVACYQKADGGDGGVDSGAGGASSRCPSGQTVAQQVVTTTIECDVSGSPTQCAGSCVGECEEGNFGLGSMGSGCARGQDGTETCRCVCAECRPE